MFSTSCSTPWPATAASPWMSTGSTRSPRVSPFRCWRARTEPSTTGFTASRCDGLNASVMCIGPPGVTTSDEKPWWYFTSPASSSWVCLPSNSENRSRGILPKVLTRTFSRPRCAIPITVSCTPAAPAIWIRWSSIGIIVSPPSPEKRFWPTYFVCR